MNGTIFGQVVSGAARRPVAGVKVWIRGPAPAATVLSLQTRSDGSFVARDLYPGHWEVAAADAVRLDVFVLARATTPVTLELQSAPFSLPVADLASWQQSPPLDGSAAVPDIHQEAPDKADLDLWAGTGGAEPGMDVQEPASTDPHLRCSGSVIGWVRDSRRESYVANATITFHSSQGSAPDIAPVSDAQGRFALDGLSEGLWIVRAIAEDGRTGESVLAVRAGRRSQVEIELDAPVGPDSITGLL